MRIHPIIVLPPEVTGEPSAAQRRSAAEIVLDATRPAASDVLARTLAGWRAAVPSRTGRMAASVRGRVEGRVDEIDWSVVWLFRFYLVRGEWSAWNGLVDHRPRLRDWPLQFLGRVNWVSSLLGVRA